MMSNIKLFLFSCLGLLFFGFVIFPQNTDAQDSSLNNNSDAPVEISAQESLEWLQNANQYKANGDVVVTQGNLILNADNLIADYDNQTGDNLNITLITGTGNIVLKDEGNTAYGDKIIYDLQTNDIVLTGKDVKLVTPSETITANESLTYNTQNGVAKAIGKAKIKTAKETLEAQTITANFQKNADTNKQELSSAIATGGVRITTDEEVITGNNGTYNALKNTADIKGNVKITRGKNSLEGNKATINLATNVSQMFGDKKTGKRVKGVFFPQSNKNNDGQ